jgi:transposase
MPGEQIPVLDRLRSEEGSVRHLIGRLGDVGMLRACYEAGPCGFDLHRLQASMGVACDVVAPSLIPRRAGDRVKTDKRDASRLARLHRAGELTPIRVPTEGEEAIRDLVRARAALLADRKRAQQRITAMLMRHGRIWRASSWTQAHERWIAGQRFDEPALAATLAHYRAALDTRLAELDAVEAELALWAGLGELRHAGGPRYLDDHGRPASQPCAPRRKAFSSTVVDTSCCTATSEVVQAASPVCLVPGQRPDQLVLE